MSNLDRACNFLVNHPRIECAVLCALFVIAGQLDWMLP